MFVFCFVFVLFMVVGVVVVLLLFFGCCFFGGCKDFKWVRQFFLFLLILLEL